MIIYYNSKELTEIFNLITLKFNNDIQFIYDIEIENNKIDYWVQYNNVNTNCLNIINYKDDKNDYSPNILNLYNYYYILECDISTISVKYENLVYLSYVIYNFIIINTNFQTNKPIVLDPISTMIYLQNNNKSFIRIGDGEVSLLENKQFSDWNYASKFNDKNKKLFKHTLTLSINNSNHNLLCGICDIFESEYFINIFEKDMVVFWNHFQKRYLNIVRNNTIYGSCFIGRVFMYNNINQNRYIECAGLLVKNKKNIIICNDEFINKYIDNYYFQSNSNVYILCENENNYDDNKIIDTMHNIINNIIIYHNNEINNVFLHYGIFSKYISSYLLNYYGITTIDFGYFNFNNVIFSINHYYDINNVLSSINYYIFHNNVIGYDILKNSTDILDESDPVIINIKEILSLNDKLEPNMQLFGIRFNQVSLSNNYLNSIIKGKLTVKSNIPLKLFNGKNWLHININSYENDFDIYNINKWRISPSNEYLNENIGKNNIEFIIYHIGFKIYEII